MWVDILVLSSGPAVLLLWYFSHKQIYKKIPVHNIVNIFFSILALGIVAYVLLSLISKYTVLHLYTENQIHLFHYLFWGVAFTEELIKILPVLLLFYRGKYFEEPYDGIYYCVTAGIAFAFLENNIYLYDNGLQVIIPRTFLTLPLHTLTGVYAGYFISKAHFCDNNRKEFGYILLGLLLAMLIHLGYNVIVIYDLFFNYYIAAVTYILILAVVAFKILRFTIKLSPYKPKLTKQPENTPGV